MLGHWSLFRFIVVDLAWLCMSDLSPTNVESPWQEDWISVNADTAEGFEPIAELHCSEAPVRSLTILRGQPSGATSDSSRGRQIQVT